MSLANNYPDYDPFAWFYSWRRSDIIWPVKCYSTKEVRSALEEVGFADVSIYDAERDLAKPGVAG